MSTPALRAIQKDAVRLAFKITGHVEDLEPQYIDPVVLQRYAEQLSEIANRLIYHRTQTPEHKEAMRKLCQPQREEDPR